MARKLQLFPAHAGVIPDGKIRCEKVEPFPRARGGDPGIIGILNAAIGFSPRTRG